MNNIKVAKVYIKRNKDKLYILSLYTLLIIGILANTSNKKGTSQKHIDTAYNTQVPQYFEEYPQDYESINVKSQEEKVSNTIQNETQDDETGVTVETEKVGPKMDQERKNSIEKKVANAEERLIPKMTSSIQNRIFKIATVIGEKFRELRAKVELNPPK